MKPFFFSSPINDEAFVSLTTAIREGCNSFYIDSGGGSYSVASAISQLLSDVPDAKMYATCRVYSVTLPMFLFSQVSHREVCASTIGMFHLSTLTYQHSSTGAPVADYDKFLKEEVKHMKNADNWFLDTLFTEKEKKIVLSGKDYYFSHKRLREMLIESDNQHLTWEDWEHAECR